MGRREKYGSLGIKHVSLVPLHHQYGFWLLLGFDVDKPSIFLSKHQMQRKTLNRIFKTPSHQEWIIESSGMNEKTYLHGFLEGVLEAIQVSSLKWYPHGLQMVGSPLQISSPREKEKKGQNSNKACMGTLFFVVLPLFIYIWHEVFS